MRDKDSDLVRNIDNNVDKFETKISLANVIKQTLTLKISYPRMVVDAFEFLVSGIRHAYNLKGEDLNNFVLSLF